MGVPYLLGLHEVNFASRVLSAIPFVTHGFGSLTQPAPEVFRNIWSERPNLLQVHGTFVFEVTRARQECGEADGAVTKMSGVPLEIRTADCVPILLARKDGRAVAALHAGWRGTLAKIVLSFARKLSELGDVPENWVAAIGPAIGPCCYEVGLELGELFRHEFGGVGVTGGKTVYLDLPEINSAQLKRAGISGIEIIRACTKCSGRLGRVGRVRRANGALFNSYRRDKTVNRQSSVIMTVGQAAA